MILIIKKDESPTRLRECAAFILVLHYDKFNILGLRAVGWTSLGAEGYYDEYISLSPDVSLMKQLAEKNNLKINPQLGLLVLAALLYVVLS